MSVDTGSLVLPKTKKHRTSDIERTEKKKRKRQNSATATVEVRASSQKRQTQPAEEEVRPEKQPEILGPIVKPQNSPFYEQTSSLYLPIAPISQRHPTSALCAEHVSPLLLSYYPPLHGVLISYSNPRLSSTPHDISAVDGRQKAFARSVDEYAASFVWLTAEFVIFRPQSGDVIEGYINLQSQNSIGVVYWNFFNASIEKSFLPKDWIWIPASMSVGKTSNDGKLSKIAKVSIAPTDDDERNAQKDGRPQNIREHDVGHFRTGEGRRIEGRIRFYVKHVYTSRSIDQEHRFLGIEGTMLEPGERDMPSEDSA